MCRKLILDTSVHAPILQVLFADASPAPCRTSPHWLAHWWLLVLRSLQIGGCFATARCGCVQGSSCRWWQFLHFHLRRVAVCVSAWNLDMVYGPFFLCCAKKGEVMIDVTWCTKKWIHNREWVLGRKQFDDLSLRITVPRVSKLRLIWQPSFSRLPAEDAWDARSLPAKSTKFYVQKRSSSASDLCHFHLEVHCRKERFDRCKNGHTTAANRVLELLSLPFDSRAVLSIVCNCGQNRLG